MSIPQNLPGLAEAALPELPAPSAPSWGPSCARLSSPWDDEKEFSLPEKRDKGTARAQDAFPSSEGGQPLLAPSYKRALNPCNPLDTNYSNLSTLNPELQQAHKELCPPRQFTLIQALKQTTAED